MLEGINILNQIEIMESPIWIAIVGLVFVGLWLISFILVIIDSFKDFTNTDGRIFLYIMIISFVGILVCRGLDDQILTEPTGVYEYQVTIDDSVSMTEFLEKYEIIEINGKIYTIREKE